MSHCSLKRPLILLKNSCHFNAGCLICYVIVSLLLRYVEYFLYLLHSAENDAALVLRKHSFAPQLSYIIICYISVYYQCYSNKFEICLSSLLFLIYNMHFGLFQRSQYMSWTSSLQYVMVQTRLRGLFENVRPQAKEMPEGWRVCGL